MENTLFAINTIFSSLNINYTSNLGDILGLFSLLFLLLVPFFNFLLSNKKTETKQIIKTLPTDKDGWSNKLKIGLQKTQRDIWGKLEQIISKTNFDQTILDEIEEVLFAADLGPELVDDLTDQIKIWKKNNNTDDFKMFLFDFLKEKMAETQNKTNKDLLQYSPNSKLKTIMIVGVNGAGKTTTIGKLATKLTKQGAKVVVGACDTFRAAAVDQLQIWCDRAGADMVRAKQGANPSGVAYEALQKAQSINADYCILDTAGRLHTKGNLMDELKKTKNVLSKLDPAAPHESLLVLDAITGQNALNQAREFHRTINITGIVFTKCDGSSKAGSAVSIVKNLDIPVVYIGVGEQVEDLNVFDLDQYLKALLGM